MPRKVISSYRQRLYVANCNRGNRNRDRANKKEKDCPACNAALWRWTLAAHGGYAPKCCDRSEHLLLPQSCRKVAVYARCIATRTVRAIQREGLNFDIDSRKKDFGVLTLT